MNWTYRPGALARSNREWPSTFFVKAMQFACFDQTSKKGNEADWTNKWTRLNDCSTSRGSSCRDSKSLAFRVRRLLSCWRRLQAWRSIAFQAKQLAPAAAPPWTEPLRQRGQKLCCVTFLMLVSEARRTRVSASLSATWCFYHAWFILGLLCAGFPGGMHVDDALIHKSTLKVIISQGILPTYGSVSAASAWAMSWKGPAKTVILFLGNLAMSACQCQQVSLSTDGEDIKIVATHKRLEVVPAALSTDVSWKASQSSP